MTNAITTVLWAMTPGILTGIVLAIWNREQKKRDDFHAQEKVRQIESEMMHIDLEVATAQLSYAVAMAVKRGNCNGEMETAICRYEKAMEKLQRFERQQMAQYRAE